MSRLWFPLVVATALGVASAQTLRVDSSGGPLTLAEELQTAIDAWQAVADPPLALSLAEDGNVSVRFASQVELGPDTLSLTIQRQSDDGTPQLEVLLEPVGYRRFPTTLLHELGIVLGLSAVENRGSVMRAAIATDAPEAPSESDAALLSSLRDAVPEDVNRDGRVDFYDLAALAEVFGAQGINLAADIDRSGVVDAADLEALREAYVFGAPSRTPPTPQAATPTPSELPAVPEPVGDPDSGDGDSDPSPPPADGNGDEPADPGSAPDEGGTEGSDPADGDEGSP